MGIRKGYRHFKRPKAPVSWCGLAWGKDTNPNGHIREDCPMCVKRRNRANGGRP